MTSLLDSILTTRLQQLQESGWRLNDLSRPVDKATTADFFSNDYLGFGTNPDVRELFMHKLSKDIDVFVFNIFDQRVEKIRAVR